MENNPAGNVKGVKRRGVNKLHKRDELTPDEVRAVLGLFDRTTPAGARDYAMIVLMCYCALRQVEVQRADIEDLKTRQGRRVLFVQGKGAEEKDELVVLPYKAEGAIRDWLRFHPNGTGALFVGLGGRNKGGRLTRRSIRRIVKDSYGLVGIVDKDKTTHSLRHSAVSQAIRKGATPIQVQNMTRHANLNTTMIYFHEIGRVANPAEDLIDY